MICSTIRLPPMPFVGNKTRRVKLLRLTANAQAGEAWGIIAIGPFRRLTDPLRGPKLFLSPRPPRGRHELRPPALATPARHPGSGRPPGRRIAPSLHARGVGWQEGIAEPGAMPGTGSVRAEQEKPLPYSHLPPIRNAISDPASAGETPPKAAHRFCRRIRPADDVFGTHNRLRRNA
jgi:hypothetical protein